MKIVLRVLLLGAVVVLTCVCIQTIVSADRFGKIKKEREEMISMRLIDIRAAQIGYKNMHEVYAGSFTELQRFLNEDRIPFLVKEGELNDDQLRAGLTEQEAVKQGIIRRDTTWVLAKDTLLNRSYDVSSIGKVPGFEQHTFILDTATLISHSGYIVPVFEANVPYDVYLGDLDRQSLINLKDKTEKMNRFSGLRVGSVREINNNAGNWEQF